MNKTTSVLLYYPSRAAKHVYEAQDMEPDAAEQALNWIGALYHVETQIRKQGFSGQCKLALSQKQVKPIAVEFFAWIEKQFDARGFLPSSPVLGALAYIRERRAGLEVYLDDAEVSIDTNHNERALRVIPMDRIRGKTHRYCEKLARDLPHARH
ncbi:IS66 family transposase [Undibacterium sp. Xuan67W]|uniref:IS66 family transposase n=1 Tax=Undibacterium sp. Xuan67W TaxID=3413057 RepID=UPI003BEFA5B0